MRMLRALALSVATVLLVSGLIVAPAHAACGDNGGVNFLSFRSATTGSAPAIFASGADTNISICFIPKGTGTVQIVGSFSGSSTQTSITTNYQVFSGDLTLAGTLIGHAGGYDAGMMGNVLGAGTITAAAAGGSTTAGVIAKYAITDSSVNASTYTPGFPRGGLVAEMASSGDAAVVATITDGDNPPSIFPNAFFQASWQASTSSKYNYGLDLKGSNPQSSVYPATQNPQIADIRTAVGACVIYASGVPTNGVSGTGVGCTKGSVYYDIAVTGGKLAYYNSNTSASPTWTNPLP